MPANPQIRARSVNRELSKVSLERVAQEQLTNHKFRKNSRMYLLMEEIYMQFEPRINKPDLSDPDRWFLPAVDFDYLDETYSKPSIIKAKKLLGIKSVRYKDYWVWTLPLMSPDRRMQELHNRQLEQIKKGLFWRIGATEKPSAQFLGGIMSENKYDMLSKDAIELMEGYKKRTILGAKIDLRIISLKKADGWHWIWPAQEVQDWLLEQLQDGPVALEHLFKIAMWSEDVVRLSAQAAGGIVIQMIDGKVHWRLR